MEEYAVLCKVIFYIKKKNNFHIEFNNYAYNNKFIILLSPSHVFNYVSNKIRVIHCPASETSNISKAS